MENMIIQGILQIKQVEILYQGIAESKGKLSAVSETGIRINGGGMPETGNPNKTWFKDVSDIISKSDMPYYMVWANFNNTDNFFAPFMANDKINAVFNIKEAEKQPRVVDDFERYM